MGRLNRLKSLRKPAVVKPAATPAPGPGAGPALLLAAGMAVMTAGLSLLLLQTDVRVVDPLRVGGGAGLALAGLAGIVAYFARWGKLSGGN